MRKEKSRDAARSRRSKENHEFYELAKLLPLPAAITSQLDFLDKASIIRLTISFLKLRQFSVNGHPPWAPDFTTLGSINPYTSTETTLTTGGESSGSAPGDETPNTQQTSELNNNNNNRKSHLTVTPGNSITPSNVAFHPPASIAHPVDTYHTSIEQQSVRSFIKTNGASLFDVHQGTHILQSLDGFAFAIGRDGRFLYISETVSMYLGLSQVEMTGSSVFDYTHQQDHSELARQLGIPYTAAAALGSNCGTQRNRDSCSPGPPASVQSQYSAASNETFIEDHMTHNAAAVARKRIKISNGTRRAGRPSAGTSPTKKNKKSQVIKSERNETVASDHLEDTNNNHRVSKQEVIVPETLNEKPTNGIHLRGDISSSATTESNRTIEGDPLVRQFCIRMKSTLTKRGCQHFKSSGYRVVHVVAHLRSYQSNDHGHLMDPLDDPQHPANASDRPTSSEANAPGATSKGKQGKRRGSKAEKSSGSNAGKLAEENSTTCKVDKKTSDKLKIIGMVAVAIALPPPSINELRLESDTFVLRLGLDLKITHVEPKITELLNYPMELLAGRSLYSFIHPADLDQARNCHRDLLQKGQMMSGYYRLLARTGGYIWIQTCATLICNNTTAPVLGSTSVLGTYGSISSPSPHLQQQQQLMINDNDNLLVMNGRGPSQHPHQYQPVYFPHAGTPTLSATSFDSPLPEHQQHSQMQSQPLQQPQQQQQQQQEQCVIFVNYMVTDVIETEEILDVCQNKDFMPIQQQQQQQQQPTNFSGLSQQQTTVISNNRKNNNSNNHNSKHDNETTNEYVSPGSASSSPCLNQGGNLSMKSGNGGAYLLPTAAHTPNIINLSSTSQQQEQTDRHWRSDEHASTRTTPSSSVRHTSGSSSRASRRQGTKESQRAHEHSQSQVYSSGSHAGAAAATTSESCFTGIESSPVGAVASYAAAAAAAAAVAAASASTYDTAARAFQSSAYVTSAVTDDVGVASGGNPLALASKHPHAHQLDSTASSWHQQHQQQQQHLQQQHQQQQQHQISHQHGYLAASHHTPAIYSESISLNNHQQVAAQAASDHYLASMDRTSIYKAATFAAAGLAASASNYAAYPSVAATYHQHNNSLSQQLERHEQPQQQHQHHHHPNHNHQHSQYHNHHTTQQNYQQSQQQAATSQQHYQAAAAAASVYSAHQHHHPPWF